MIADGTLTQKDSFFEFTKDEEFSSSSAAAAVIESGSANGLIEWTPTKEKSSKNSTNKPNLENRMKFTSCEKTVVGDPEVLKLLKLQYSKDLWEL